MSDADLPAGRPPAVWPAQKLEALARWLATSQRATNVADAQVIRDAIASHADLLERYVTEKAAWRAGLARKFDSTIEAENQRMVNAVWNYLGVRTPEALADWVGDAQDQIRRARQQLASIQTHTASFPKSAVPPSDG